MNENKYVFNLRYLLIRFYYLFINRIYIIQFIYLLFNLFYLLFILIFKSFSLQIFTNFFYFSDK